MLHLGQQRTQPSRSIDDFTDRQPVEDGGGDRVRLPERRIRAIAAAAQQIGRLLVTAPPRKYRRAAWRCDRSHAGRCQSQTASANKAASATTGAAASVIS